MAEPTPTEMTEKLAELMRERAGVRGRDLARQLKRAPRVLPRRLRRDAQVLLEAEKVGGNPRLSRTVDRDRAALAYANLLEYLESIDPADRRKNALIGWAASMAFNIILIVIAALVVYFLIQQPLAQ